MHLQQELVDRYAQGPSQLRDSINNLRARVPNCLSTNADQPDKAEAVEMFVSRYNIWHLNHLLCLFIVLFTGTYLALVLQPHKVVNLIFT